MIYILKKNDVNFGTPELFHLNSDFKNEGFGAKLNPSSDWL